jgi:hypothetical protein
MPFALRVVNDGAPAKFDAIEGECQTRVIVSPDPNAQAPTSATMRVALLDRSKPGMGTLGHRQSLALRRKTEVWGIVGWELPDNTPRIVRLFEARFTLKRHGVPIFTTPLYAFAMQSREGVFEETVAEASEEADDARALLKVIDGMQGTLSAGVKELRGLLTVTLYPAPAI